MESFLIKNAPSVGVTTVGVYLILKLVFDFINKEKDRKAAPKPPIVQPAPCNEIMGDLAASIRSQTKMMAKLHESNIKTLEAINRVENHLIVGGRRPMDG
jgi:hypothetical protein